MNPAPRKTVPVSYGTIRTGPSDEKSRNDGHAEDDGVLPHETTSHPVASSRVLDFFYAFRLEIFVVLYLHGRVATSTVVQDLLLQKACLVDLGHAQSACEGLDGLPEVKNQAERIASNYSMGRVIVYMGPSAAVAILIGPWCDRYGYKTPLLVANLGYIVSTTVTLFTVYWMHLPLYFNVLAMVFDGLSGGFVVVFMAVFSEATLGTSSKRRLSKFTTINVAMSLAFPLGLYAGGQIYGAFGVNAVLLFALSSSVLAELWAVVTFSVPEGADGLEDGAWTRAKNLFQLRNFLEGFRACTRGRPARGRTQLWCLLVVLCSRILDVTRFGTAYYFVRKMYSWSVPYYSTVTAVTAAATVALNLPIVWFFARVLKLPDLWMSVVGAACSVAQLLLCGLAYHEWLYYLQCAVGVPSFLAYVATRTHLSKLLESNEVGRVYSFLSSCESLVPILGEVVLTQIFNLSLDFMPGLAYLTAAAVSILPLALLGYCIHISRQSYASVQECRESVQAP